jgi:hypothetical protein
MSANYFPSAPPLEQVGTSLGLRIDHLLVYFEKKNRTAAKAMRASWPLWRALTPRSNSGQAMTQGPRIVESRLVARLERETVPRHGSNQF